MWIIIGLKLDHSRPYSLIGFIDHKERGQARCLVSKMANADESVLLEALKTLPEGERANFLREERERQERERREERQERQESEEREREREREERERERESE